MPREVVNPLSVLTSRAAMLSPPQTWLIVGLPHDLFPLAVKSLVVLECPC
jgi:hypothetical protein